MSKKIKLFLSKISSNLSGRISSLISSFITRGIIGNTINEMISSHIMMYHEASEAAKNPPKPNLKDLLPPPTPKQIINNLEAFIKKQNDCFGHASDKKDITKELEILSIDELNKFHDQLSSLNKSFFEDHDYSIWKVEQKAFNEAFDMQKELDSRGFIEIDSKNQDGEDRNDQ